MDDVPLQTLPWLERTTPGAWGMQGGVLTGMATARSKPLRPSRGPLAATSSTHHGQQEHGYVSATVLFTPQKTQSGWKHFLPIKVVKAGDW